MNYKPLVKEKIPQIPVDKEFLKKIDKACQKIKETRCDFVRGAIEAKLSVIFKEL